jgi:polysaccharide biosynthesis/export protein
MIDTARLSKFFCKMLLIGLSCTPLAVLGFAILGLPQVASAKPKVLPQPSKIAPSTQQRRQNNNPNAYTLGPGDRVRVDVFNVPEYSGEFIVLVDGTLNLPLVGAIPVAGRNLNQASQIIEQAYRGFVRVPNVTVGLLLARPIQITIAGEVNRAGSYNIPLSETRKFPTLSQAVQLAGGVNQTSNLRRVRVTRGNRVGYFDLLAVLQNADPTQDLTLRDGDAVFVPTATNVNASDIARISDSNIGSQDAAIKIVVIGEVSKPGTYNMKAESSGTAGTAGGTGGRLNLPTLTEALRLAGGSTASADASRIVVQRLTRNGPPQRISVNLLRLLNAGDTTQDLPLQNGDTIYLPTDPVIGSAGSRQLAASSFGPQVLNPIKIAVVGQVNRPGTYNVKGESNASGSATIQNVNFSIPTVTQAIQSAGGIKPTADVRRIKLLRINRDGRGQAKTINLWALLTQGDSSQDLPLQEGDRIIIPEIPAGTSPNPGETDTLANAPFSPGVIRVNVVGEIKGSRQGGATIELPPTTTLNQAILAAGGFDPVRANKNSIDLIRLNPNGSVTKRTIGVDFAKGVDETINPTLRNNDIVVIGRSGTTRVGDGLGSVLNPLSPLLNLFNIFR